MEPEGDDAELPGAPFQAPIHDAASLALASSPPVHFAADCRGAAVFGGGAVAVEVKTENSELRRVGISNPREQFLLLNSQFSVLSSRYRVSPPHRFRDPYTAARTA